MTVKDRATGSNEPTEIEITPAMIEAGYDELCHHDLRDGLADELRVAVHRVFLAMLAEHRKSFHSVPAP